MPNVEFTSGLTQLSGRPAPGDRFLVEDISAGSDKWVSYADTVNLAVEARGDNLWPDGNLFIGDLSVWTPYSGSWTRDVTDYPDGVGVPASVSSADSQAIISASVGARIPIEATEYEMSVWAKNSVGGSIAYIGIIPHDIEGNVVQSFNSIDSRFPGSALTTLAADLNPGDTTVTVTDATGWALTGDSVYSRYIAVWPYTNTAGKVWGNYTYTRHTGIYSSRSGNVLTLSAPWAGPARPAGSAVANTQIGGTFIYATSFNPTTSWAQYRAVLNLGPVGSSYSTGYRTGMSYALPVMLGNYSAVGTIRFAAMTMRRRTAPSNVQEFTSSGTWTKPTWFPTGTPVTIEIIGGGAGGGSGRRGAAGTIRGGGGGGGGGSVTTVTVPIEQLPATLTVTVGAGGAGGAAPTTDNTDGNPGSPGGFSQVAGSSPTFNYAANGAFLSTCGGGGGTASGGGLAGHHFSDSLWVRVQSGGGAIAAGSSAGDVVPDPRGGGTCCGGAGGGGVDASNVHSAGGPVYGLYTNVLPSYSAGVAGGGAGADGPQAPTSLRGLYGIGGGGGGGNNAGGGGRGGDGARGCGGGGGGGTTNGTTGGRGGNGGGGFVRITVGGDA